MHKKLFGLFLICMFVSTLSVSQAALNILMDEDFEGAAAFQDQSWPIQDATVAPVSVTPKGLNLRSYSNSAGNTAPKATVTNGGTVVSARKFLGTKSLQLATGQTVACPGPVINGGENEAHVMQFALGASDAVAGLAAGTQVGHFKWNWSTNSTNAVEATIGLNFVTNASGQVEVKCANNSATVGTLAPGAGNWLMISVIAVVRVTTPEFGGMVWRAYDPVTSSYKGPQPNVIQIPPSTTAAAYNDVAANFKQLGSGVQIFVDSNTTATKVLPDQVAVGWGNDNADPENAILNSTQQGWEFAATNNGTIFLDEMYWDNGTHANVLDALYNESAARMSAFDAKTTELSGPPVASSKTWDLY